MENSWEIWLAGTIRLWAVLAVQPHWRLVTGNLWPFIAGIVALSLACPELGANWYWSPDVKSVERLVQELGIELLFGAVIGLIASLPGYALVGSISQNDSTINGQNPVEGFQQLCILLILSLALTTNAHFPLLTSLHDILVIIPIGFFEQTITECEELHSWWDLVAIAELTHSFLLLGFSLATPVLAMSCCIEVVVSSLKRFSIPSSNQWQVIHPWVRLTVCLFGLFISWRVFPSVWFNVEH